MGIHRNGRIRLAGRFSALWAAAAAHALAGQQVVSLPKGDVALSWDLELVSEIGGPEGPEWTQFQRLNGAAFGPDGRLYLLDGDAPRVVALSTQGGFMHYVGQSGKGPGEYARPNGVVALPGGDVVLFDGGKRAFLRYSAEGESRGEIRLDLSEGLPDGPLAASQDGSVLSFPMRLISSRLGHAFLSGRGVVSGKGSFPLLRLPLTEGLRGEVLAWLPEPSRNPDVTGSVIRVYEPDPSFGVLAGGRVAVLASEDYEIRILAPDGSLERTLTRPLPARATESGDRRAYEKSLTREGPTRRRSIGGGGGGGAQRRAPDPWFYPVIAPVLSITADGNETLWVLRRDPDDPTAQGPIDLISRSGEYLGTFPANGHGLPAAFGPDGLVVFLEHGDFDVPLARVYRLPRSLRGRG